jgi:hypothetical protein
VDVIRSNATLALWCAAGAVAACGLPALAQAHPGARKPQIKARPDNVMVREHTVLKGARFAPNTTIELRECGRSFWLAPEEPCNTANAVSVHTDSHGRFVTSFMAEVCPEGVPGEVITERTCYIGEPKASEDSTTLLGAVKLIVTYP